MAFQGRTQQPETRTAGALNKFVTDSSLQRSSQGHEMRKSVMEASAAKRRNQDTLASQRAQSDNEIQAAVKMQDHRLAAQTRNQEYEAGVRALENEDAQEHEVLLEKLIADRELAADDLDWKREQVAKEELKDEKLYENMMLMVGKANTARQVVNIGRINKKFNTGKAKLDAQQAAELKEWEEMKTIQDIATKTAISALETDRLNTITRYKDIPQESLRKMKVARGVGGWGLEGGGAREIKKFNDMTMAKGVNDALGLNLRNGVTIEQLTSAEGIKEVEKMISEGEVTSKDFVPMHATLRVAEEKFQALADESYKGKDEQAQVMGDYYQRWSSRMGSAQDKLQQLNYAKTTITMGEEEKEGAPKGPTIVVGSVAKQGNLWAALEFDADWFINQNARLKRQQADETGEMEKEFDGMSPIFISPDNQLITDYHRSRPGFMRRVHQGGYSKAAKKWPEIYRAPAEQESFLGEGGITLPPPVGRAKTQFNTSTQKWERR